MKCKFAQTAGAHASRHAPWTSHVHGVRFECDSHDSGPDVRKILVDSASLDVDTMATMLCDYSAANGCWLHFGCSWLSRWLPRRLLRPAALPLVGASDAVISENATAP